MGYNFDKGDKSEYCQQFNAIIEAHNETCHFAICTNRSEADFKNFLEVFLKDFFGKNYDSLSAFKFGNGKLNNKNANLTALQQHFEISNPAQVLLMDDDLEHCITPAAVGGFSVAHCGVSGRDTEVLLTTVAQFVVSPQNYYETQKEHYLSLHKQHKEKREQEAQLKLIVFDIDGTLAPSSVELSNALTCISPDRQKLFKTIVTTFSEQCDFAICTNRVESEFEYVLKPFLLALFDEEHFTLLREFKFGNGRLNDKNQNLKELQVNCEIHSAEQVLLVDDELQHCVTPAFIAGFSVLHCNKESVTSGTLLKSVATFVESPAEYRQAQAAYYQEQHVQFQAQEHMFATTQAVRVFSLNAGSSSLARRRARTLSASAVENPQKPPIKLPQRSLSMGEEPSTHP